MDIRFNITNGEGIWYIKPMHYVAANVINGLR